MCVEQHGVTARLLVADAAIGAIIGKKGAGLQQASAAKCV